MLRQFLGENDIMAYLCMMAIRLIELRRVLRPTGSLYLHCDPTASHYLKVLLDALFGPACFRNEVIWRYRRWPRAPQAERREEETTGPPLSDVWEVGVIAPIGKERLGYHRSFAQRLVTQGGIATIPVSAFYDRGAVSSVIRFWFAKRRETLDAALERLERFLKR